MGQMPHQSMVLKNALCLHMKNFYDMLMRDFKLEILIILECHKD